MTKKNKREKDAIDGIVDQMDLKGIIYDELFGERTSGQGIDEQDSHQVHGSRMDSLYSLEGNHSNSCNGHSSKNVTTREENCHRRFPGRKRPLRADDYT